MTIYKIKETDTQTGKVHITPYGWPSAITAQKHCDIRNHANLNKLHTVHAEEA